MDAGSAAAAEVEAATYQVDGEARRTTEIEVDDETLRWVETTLIAARTSVAQHFAMTLSGNEGAAFLRYRTGDFYGAHRDSLGPGSPFVRRVTVVVFLNSGMDRGGAAGFSGGALRLYEGSAPDGGWIDLLPRCGTLAAFPSDIVHEVLPITAGVRDVVADRLY
jgi:predicted 2-oxoglutarate/Fe(II)-dependent dioxygenase YbiX